MRDCIQAILILLLAVACGATAKAESKPSANEQHFQEQVAPILARRCLSCHSAAEAKGDISLETFQHLDENGFVEPGDADGSYLVELLTPNLGKAAMPKNADPLSEEDLAAVKQWIDDGAHWPAEFRIEEPQVADLDFWSLKPLARPELPKLMPEEAAWCRNEVDYFIRAKQKELGLAPAPEADKRVLIRRLYYDLTSLPPSPEEIEAFVADEDPQAYEKLVDKLLASERYGERWARHWLDVVHYGDTHGYDKDQLRPNAWPYRDYVIRAFNEDKPYARFVQEQVAGDVLWPDTTDGVVATGFIAAGPWDFIGHAEVPETKIDGMVARSLDRDDMVGSTMSTFVSMTAQCARCHNHKFDPITQEDYFSLQAVFAALDRTDRPYEKSDGVAKQRAALTAKQETLEAELAKLDAAAKERGGEELQRLDGLIAQLQAQKDTKLDRAAFGYHSGIESNPDVEKWVQIDLGGPTSLSEIIYVACHDNFAGIGAGFGFPVRYKIEASNDPAFENDVQTIVDHTKADVANPGVELQRAAADGVTARYVRFTATKLSLRQADYIFALGELMVYSADGVNVAVRAPVTSLDSIEALPRWSRANLVDGYYYGLTVDPAVNDKILQHQAQRTKLLDTLLTAEQKQQSQQLETEAANTAQELAALPAPGMVYAGTVHYGDGNFRGTHGVPREIHVLSRGEVTQPLAQVGPGTVPIIEGVDHRWEELPLDGEEGRRRVKLAEWLVREDNPLTWRSIVNRVWLYHMGRGIVDSPNDFGRMGQPPTHPELLDWLAVEFRDNGQSFKQMHRLICNSAAYRQSSRHDEAMAEIDGSNAYYWRANRQKLSAESVRDTVLVLAGKMNFAMYGPGFQDFVIENPAHSPHYQYHKHNPDDPASHRRSIYRFLVRSQQQPFMQTLDCADPSQSIAKRDKTLTSLQALTMMNNQFTVRMAEHFASRLQSERETLPEQIARGFYLATGREPSEVERQALVDYAGAHGLPNACRVIMNLNESMFLD